MKVIPKDILVIGSGVGGLISSSLLSQSGFNTVLIEKNDRCGGRMNSEYLQNGNDQYRFDVGPSLLLLPDIYKKTFQSLNVNMEDYIKLLKVEPFYTCYFEEDQTFSYISHDAELIKKSLDSIEINGYTQYKEYISIANDYLQFGLPFVIEENFKNINFKHLFSFLIACIKIFPLFSHDKMLRKFFTTSKLRSLMSFQDLYIGLSPYQAPAIFSLLQALEFENGIYYPQGR